MGTKLKTVIAVATVIIVSVLLLFVRSCVPTPVNEPGDRYKDSLKAEILKDLGRKDSVKKIIVYRDSIHEVVKWKYRKDKLKPIPCDSLLPIIIADCDTIITADSALISSLKAEILFDSLIISDQAKIMRQDSATIESLTRKVKRLKWHRRILATVLGGSLFLNVLK